MGGRASRVPSPMGEQEEIQMEQITVCIPGRVPHRIPAGGLDKFLARYPEAALEPVTTVGEAAKAPAITTPFAQKQVDRVQPLGRLKKTALAELLREEFSYEPPSGWDRKQLIEELTNRRQSRTE
jgi:hypothetical protein